MGQELDVGMLTILILVGYCYWTIWRWISSQPPSDLKGAKAPAFGTPLPLPKSPAESSALKDDARRWGPPVEPGSAAAEGLVAIRAADRSFDAARFLRGAVSAYEAVLRAFADGDRDTLLMLVDAEVHAVFLASIEDRETQEERTDLALLRIDSVRIVDASIREASASITVRFSSLFSTCRRRRDGLTADGSTAAFTDEWIFARELRSWDPNWKLVATGSA